MGVGFSENSPKKSLEKKKKVIPKNETFSERMKRILEEKRRELEKKVPNKEEAPKVAKNSSETTVKKGKGKIEASKKKITLNKEAILKKPIQLKSFQIDGVTITRKTEGKKTTFLVGGKPIDLAKWIQERTKDREKKQIDTALKPYAAFFKKVKLSEKDRTIKLKELTDRIKARGDVSPGLMSQAAQLSQLALTQKNPTQFTVKSTLKLHYGRVLPPRVDTMIIKRADGTTMVCMRDDGVPGHPYRDLATLKVIYPQKGDDIDIVRVSPSKAEISANKEKDKNKRKKTTSGGGYAGGGGGSYSNESYSAGAPSKLGSTIPSVTETPESMKQHCTQETFRVPGKHMFASMLSPNLKKYPKLKKSKPKLVLYFAGRGYYDVITKWVRQNGRSTTPPPSVLAQAAREDFLGKRIFNTAKARWAQGENVHITLVTHMRNFISPSDKESGNGRHWYGELRKSASAKALIGAVSAKFKAKSGAKSVKEFAAVGFSMGGRAVAGLSELERKGKLPYKIALKSLEGSYFNINVDKIKENPKESLYLTFRPGSGTAAGANNIISKLRLKGQKRGKETVFTNPQYPNVRVIASSSSHGAHPGEYLNAALEIDKKAKATGAKFASKEKGTKVTASSKKVKVA